MADMQSYVVDAGTGEIKLEVRPGDRVKVVRKESLEHIAQFQTWTIDGFYKAHAKELALIMDDLNVNEKVFLFSVANFVGYEDCCLKYPNGKDITTDNLADITGLSRSVIYSTIASLMKKDILYKGKNSNNRQYFINPWLFCKGNRINKVLKTMFKNYRVRVCGGVKWQDLK